MTPFTTSPHIALIAPFRTAVAQPFAGGLEAHVWALAGALSRRGHQVTAFAAQGSGFGAGVDCVAFAAVRLSDAARQDVSMVPDTVLAEHHAYLSLMLALNRDEHRVDVVHNHSLHYLPLAMAGTLNVPMVTTLHTPPTPWLESAVTSAPAGTSSFVAVSAHVAQAWQPLLGPVPVIRNGVDTDSWQPGPGGGGAIWSGRIAPEKAPHLAVAAARRAGIDLVLAGPVVDRDYYRNVLAPLLGPDARYLGHLDHRALGQAVGRASVAVVTPVWDEPYGLVVAEALACGTPVAAFARGGIPEIVDATCARLAPADDVAALAVAIRAAAVLDRGSARRRAELHCSIEAMADGYARHYEARMRSTTPVDHAQRPRTVRRTRPAVGHRGRQLRGNSTRPGS